MLKQIEVFGISCYTTLIDRLQNPGLLFHQFRKSISVIRLKTFLPKLTHVIMTK